MEFRRVTRIHHRIRIPQDRVRPRLPRQTSQLVLGIIDRRIDTPRTHRRRLRRRLIQLTPTRRHRLREARKHLRTLIARHRPLRQVHRRLTAYTHLLQLLHLPQKLTHLVEAANIPPDLHRRIRQILRRQLRQHLLQLRHTHRERRQVHHTLRLLQRRGEFQHITLQRRVRPLHRHHQLRHLLLTNAAGRRRILDSLPQRRRNRRPTRRQPTARAAPQQILFLQQPIHTLFNLRQRHRDLTLCHRHRLLDRQPRRRHLRQLNRPLLRRVANPHHRLRRFVAALLCVLPRRRQRLVKLLRMLRCANERRDQILVICA